MTHLFTEEEMGSHIYSKVKRRAVSNSLLTNNEMPEEEID
jgi:hypothetical protein